MSLTLYLSRTVHSGADAVLSEIREGDGRHVVIVPDAFTLATERSLAAKLGKQGIFDIEVMSFARLASVVLGAKIKKCLSPAGCVMLMEKVVGQEEEHLRYYRRAARKAGFASELYAAITSIRNSGVTADRLSNAAEKLHGFVGDKTHDIALLYSAYLAELNLRHTDSTTRLEALTSEILSSEDFGDVHFHVADHADLNAKQIEVLAALMRRARSVSVAVTVGGGEGNDRIYPPLYGKLLRAAGKDVPVREVVVKAELAEEKETLLKELFSYSFSQGRATGLSLWEAKDISEEVTCLATEITDLVRRKGLRYADIAVITPSFEEYRPYMERIFRRYDIPLFADERCPLSESDVFRHIVTAMGIVDASFDGKLVRKYLAHPLFDGATEREKSEFCDYVDRSGVRFSAFTKPFFLYEEDALFAPAERVRALLCAELGPLTALSRSGSVRLYVDALRCYLKENDFDGKIAAYHQALLRVGAAKEAEICRQTPEAIRDLLDTLEDLRGDEEITYADFVLSLTAGASQVKIAALPVSLDCVYFAAVEQAMYAPIPALFVLGAEEGLFPLETVKEGILGPREYAAWQSSGIEIRIENTGVEELAASRFHVLQILLRGERTYLSHIGGRAPSPCFAQLAEIFGGEEGVRVKRCSEVLDGYPIEILIPTREVAESALTEYSRRSREGLLGEKDELFARTIAQALGTEFPLPYREDHILSVSGELARKLYFRKGTVSSSELEKYFRCPFIHFVQYGLRAQEKKVAEHDARDVGNIAHKCMERFVGEYVMSRERGAIGDEEAREIARSIAAEIVKEPSYQAIKEQEGEHVLKREIKRCGEIAITVKNQIYASEFLPTFLEKYFDGRELAPVSEGAPDGRLRSPRFGEIGLVGKIDRVDVLPARRFDREERYAVAYDYKTGNNVIDTKDLYYGIKVQLPLYLEVLRLSGYRPIGALYVSLSDARGNKPQFLYGPKLGNVALMECLDGTLSSGRASYTGLSTKEGELSETKAAFLVTAEELDALSDYAVAIADRAISEIIDGFVQPSPLKTGEKSPCDHCDFQAICRHKEACLREPSSEKIGAADILAMTEEA